MILIFRKLVAVLSISPGDEDALKCKVVALIKDDKTKEALSVIRSCKSPTLDFSFFKVGNKIGHS